MCLTNDLTTILLLLLTFLLTALPPTTTTTTTATLTAGQGAGRAAAEIAAFSTSDPVQSSGSAAKRRLLQQQQQLNPLMHTNSYALAVEPPALEIASTGTQLLPHVENSLIASLVNSQQNSNNHHQNNNNNNNMHMHMPPPAPPYQHTYNIESSANNNVHTLDERQQQQQHRLEQSLSPFGDDMEESDRTYPPPVFDFGMPRNITARSGQTAAINCRVENLGDKSVSWIRKRDLHILTAGILTYTSDERFKVIRTVDSKDWTLHVKYAQPRDSGIYECQVNTEPKISMAFRLNVIVTPPDAKAIIVGPADLYVKVGSAITLTCHVKQPSSAQDIGPIYWYRGPYIITPFVAHPNEAAIDLQRISMESKLGEKLQSRLRIANAQTIDSGNYTCMPTTADAASVVVNVINDESPAAMQKSAATSTYRNSCSRLGRIIIACISATAVRWLLLGQHPDHRHKRSHHHQQQSQSQPQHRRHHRQQHRESQQHHRQQQHPRQSQSQLPSQRRPQLSFVHIMCVALQILCNLFSFSS